MQASLRAGQWVEGALEGWQVEACSTHVAVTCPSTAGPCTRILVYAFQVRLGFAQLLLHGLLLALWVSVYVYLYICTMVVYMNVYICTCTCSVCVSLSLSLNSYTFICNVCFSWHVATSRPGVSATFIFFLIFCLLHCCHAHSLPQPLVHQTEPSGCADAEVPCISRGCSLANYLIFLLILCFEY